MFKALGKTTWALAKPFAKRRARKRVERVGDTAREIAISVTTYAPGVARLIAALTPQKKRKRLAPRLAAGAALGTGAAVGAAALYFLETESGRERRKRLRRSGK
jgi:hypothetical protein